MKTMDLGQLPPWEQLLKRVLWAQLGDIRGKRILDFGSGIGVTADHYAADNEVVAVEPSGEAVQNRWQENSYRQITGSREALKEFPDESFDVIFCHNVLEYAEEREVIVREFHRLLKPEGFLSVVKHNRSGRVMQMAVLLNDFEKANSLLDGENGTASQYGTICYYEDGDISRWCNGFRIEKTSGIRTFWDLQQNQQCHKDPAWQEKMVQLELRVSQLEEYRSIAFFHHLIFKKEAAMTLPPDMTCRMMTETDINLVIPMYMEQYNGCEDGEWTQQTTYKRIHQVWSREDSICMLLQQGSEAVGFVMGYFEQYDDIAAYDLVEIVIKHEHQGKGIGTRFMEQIEAKIKEMGGAMIQLQAVNDAMHDHFYGKLGYRNCSNLVLKSKWL